jgi:hypothetical protein
MNYKTILDSQERDKYRNYVLKAAASTSGLIVMIGFVGYTLITYKRSEQSKKIFLISGLSA